jgi:sodium-dependent dicarboxylate transporter 2/3/5
MARSFPAQQEGMVQSDATGGVVRRLHTEHRASTAPVSTVSQRQTLRASARALSGCIIIVVATEIALGELDTSARRALQVFGIAIVGWTLTRLDDVFVALVAAIAMALFVVGRPDDLFAALGNKSVWLLMAAFILAEAFRVSGLADLLARRVTAKAHTLRRLFYSLTAVMIASAFVIPSTTGRAAALLPVFTNVATTMTGARTRVAFALLFPTGILLGTFGSLVGAGAHVAAVEILSTMTGRTISFAYWTLLALPLAAVTSFLAAEIILRLFLTGNERNTPIAPLAVAPTDVRVLRRPVLLVAAAVLTGWMTKSWHGIDETLVALAGALFVTAPVIGVVRFKDALRAVDWGLLIFLAATVFLAQALINSKVAEQLLQGPFAVLSNTNAPPLVVAGAVALLGIALHLVVHSRTARVAVLLPPILLLAVQAGLDPLAVMLVTVASTGFCQTLMVSAKPVIVFGKIEGVTYTQRDLLCLSAVIAPLHLALILVFAGFVWPSLGLGLSK